jgi:AcrR family transcriptional regulator
MRMLAGAKALFRKQGFALTTMDGIAREAGVAVQTIYFTFGSKRAILKELLDVAVAGDDEPVPTLDRQWVHDAVTAVDPHVQVQIQVAAARDIFERVAPVLEIVRNAAAADPEMADLWRTNTEQRMTVQLHLVTALAAKGGLRPGLTLAHAADIMFALESPELYQLLVAERGWPAQEWEQFVVDALYKHVLPPEHPSPVARQR